MHPTWSLYNLPVTETLSLPFGRENKMAKQEQDINKEEAAEERKEAVPRQSHVE